MMHEFHIREELRKLIELARTHEVGAADALLAQIEAIVEYVDDLETEVGMWIDDNDYEDFDDE